MKRLLFITVLFFASFNASAYLGDITNGQVLINDFSANLPLETVRLAVTLNDQNAERLFDELGESGLASESKEAGVILREMIDKGIECQKSANQTSCTIMVGF